MGRKRSKTRRAFIVRDMLDQHKEIARRIALGQKNVSIAKDLGVTTSMVSYTRNSPIVMDQISELHAVRDGATIDIMKEIRDFAPSALGLLKDVVKGNGSMKDAPMTLRARTAENWLDRAGFAPVKKFSGEMLHGHLTGEEIEQIKREARQEMELKNVTPSEG